PCSRRTCRSRRIRGSSAASPSPARPPRPRPPIRTSRHPGSALSSAWPPRRRDSTGGGAHDDAQSAPMKNQCAGGLLFVLVAAGFGMAGAGAERPFDLVIRGGGGVGPGGGGGGGRRRGGGGRGS